MRAGDLRKRITFQTRGTATDTFGAQTPTWSDLFTTWASIDALTAREIFAAQAVNSEVTHTIIVRYTASLSVPKVVAAMRILYSGRIFNIAGMNNVDERNRTIQLTAAESMNNG
jgi:SPP1 family predicted phage head-tail adaptor